MRFEEFTLNEDVLKGIKDAGFEECMPVQEETLKRTLEGKDVTVQSQTGSGKTAAFLVSIFQLWTTTVPEKRRSTMIIAPTRELAVQIEEEAKLLGAHVGMKIGCFYGGVGYKQQEDALKKGVDLYIGTPGRLIDFGQSKKIDFRSIGALVIDEADRLFDMGFYPDIKKMMRMMGPREERMTLLFSATLGTKVLQVAWEHMNMPEEIVMKAEHITVNEISQELFHVESSKKFQLMLGLLKKHNPSNAIVFTNMKITAVEVAKRLSKNGYAARYLMGDLPQKKRLSVINKVKQGEIRFLVATDVAARGLHVDDLEMVINYDIPEDPESYVHRIGRTARAGKSGKAFSLACESYVYGLEPIEELIDMKIPVSWAEEELFVEDASEGIDYRAEYRKASRDGKGKSGRDRNRGSSQRPQSKGRPTSRPPQRRKPQERRTPQRKDSRAPQKKKAQPQRRPSKEQQGAKSPTRDTALEKRLEMYRKKYGEDFQIAGAKQAGSKSSGSKRSGNRKSGAKRSASRQSAPKKAGAQQQSAKKAAQSQSKPQPKKRAEQPRQKQKQTKAQEKKGLISSIKKALFKK